MATTLPLMPLHAHIEPTAHDSGAPDVVQDTSPSQIPAIDGSNDTTAANGPSSSATTPLNVLSVALGDRLIKPWYPSLYREELVGTAAVERLYVCPSCFRYTGDAPVALAHWDRCEHLTTLPGRPIYCRGRHTLHELDGEHDQLFAQNLSLFAKLFIDNKSVCFDVGTFLYYLLYEHDDDVPGGAGQMIGFFSKEKLSWDANNLACILVFPPWQRRGLGQLLMGASYAMSRREGRLGGPERPLSDLGRHSYTTYWCRALARQLLSLAPAHKPSPSTKKPNPSATTAFPLSALSTATGILPDDVVFALQHMRALVTTAGGAGGAVQRRKGDGAVGVCVPAVRAWVAGNGWGRFLDVGDEAGGEGEGFLDEEGE